MEAKEAEEAEEAEAGARAPEKVAEETGEAEEARDPASQRALPCPPSSPGAFAPSTRRVRTQFCSFVTPSAVALHPRPVRVAL